jgi:hypothetical protein
MILFCSQVADSIESKCQTTTEVDVASNANVLSKLSFVIVSHIAFTGHTQELENFLKQRSCKLMLIGQPFSYAPQNESTATIYEKGILKSAARFPQLKGPELVLYFKDFFATFYFILKFRSKFHIYVGVDPLNALVGLLLKRLGFVKVVIFYVIDYVPTRFKNRILKVCII